MKYKQKTVNWLIVSVLSLLVIGFLLGMFFSYSHFQKNRFQLGIYHGNDYKGIAKDFQRVEAVQSYHHLKKLWIALDKGRIDGVLADRLQGLAAIAKEHFVHLKPSGRALNYQLQAVAFRKEDNFLCQSINQGLKDIINNQIYCGISEEYFGRNTAAEVTSKMEPDSEAATNESGEQNQHLNNLRLAFQSDNPPFSYLDKDKKLTGFDVEIAWALCIQLGIRYFQPVAIQNHQLLATLKSNKNIDGAWGVAIEPVMKNKVIFSNPYRISGAQLFVRKDSPIDSPKFLIPPQYPELPPGMGNAQSNITSFSNH
jgi:ABC-type amino acid transport substrate-binding protein